jgi:hypothetical protein
MTNSDRLLEKVYDLADKQSTEHKRAEVVRAALIAAQHRAEALKMKSEPRKDKKHG